MKRYKVKALSVGGRGKKIYRSGDIVVASNFPDENAEKLVRDGFLVPYDEIDEVTLVTDQGTEGGGNPDDLGGQGEGGKSGTEGGNQDDLSGGKSDDDLITIDTYTKKELSERLLIAGVPFDPQAKKEDLFNLFVNTKKSSLTE